MIKQKNELFTKPAYNIKSVSERTGIPPVTLRAWERRYGFPDPGRTESGYRLYSDFEVAALNWLKLQTESGLSIGQAVKLLQDLLERGESPFHLPSPDKIGDYEHQTTKQIQEKLVEALLSLDGEQAERITRSALNLYTLETVMLEVFAPTMIEVGEQWHAGKIGVAVEHFASQHCRMHLMKALESTHDTATKGSIVAACAPGEWHELGILILTVLLRSRGWAITYLGPNLSLERLSEALVKLEPQMLLFSATVEDSAENLIELIDVLSELPDPKPIIGLGGQAFQQNPSLTNRIPGSFVGPGADDAANQVEKMLDQKG